LELTESIDSNGGAQGDDTANRLSISIVTPNFNGASYIEKTLTSVLDQQYPVLDYVVADGASEDGSLEIIKRYERLLSGVISEPDRGHADAINKGFARSSGEIMGWINSDDILLPGALDFVDRLFRARPDIEWITGRASSMDEQGEIRWAGPIRPWSRLRFLAGDNKWIQQESTFWRRSLWERAGGRLDLDYDLANDFELWARFFRFAELHTVNRFLGCFRIREGQRSIAFKQRYEAEARSVLRRELRSLEPTWRRKYGSLMPAFGGALRPPVAIGADHRFRICDPPIIEPAELHLPAPRIVEPSERAEAPDPLARFHKIHKGERCFIMGNGPSLNRMDLSKLAGETVFACNSVFLLFDRINWRPLYYACVDSRVLPDRAQDIDAMLRAHPKMTGFFPSVIQEHTGSKRRRPARLILPTGANRFFFNEVANSSDNLPHSMFSYDIDVHVVQPYTVAITLMQIAAYMGFSEIYLIGCDTDYVVTDTVREERDSQAPGVALTSRKDDDPNHFDPSYFGRNRKWHAPRPEKMILHYEHARDALDRIGVAVYNATLGGKLEVFPRRDFNTLFCVGEEPMTNSSDPENRSTADDRRGGAIGLLWRARTVLLFLTGSALAVGAASFAPAFAPAKGYILGAAAFLALLGLIAYTALRLRGFIMELSQQVLDLADGAHRPAEGAVLASIERDMKVDSLRAEIEDLRRQLAESRLSR